MCAARRHIQLMFLALQARCQDQRQISGDRGQAASKPTAHSRGWKESQGAGEGSIVSHHFACNFGVLHTFETHLVLRRERGGGVGGHRLEQLDVPLHAFADYGVPCSSRRIERQTPLQQAPRVLARWRSTLKPPRSKSLFPTYLGCSVYDGTLSVAPNLLISTLS